LCTVGSEDFAEPPRELEEEEEEPPNQPPPNQPFLEVLASMSRCARGC